MEREFLEGLPVGEQPLTEEVIEAILQRHGQELAQLRLQSGLELAVARAGGRNVKAIAALLDLDAISGSQDISAALDTALAQLKKENGYLFEEATPPPYARFTGTGGSTQDQPATLAGAIRARMERLQS